MGLKSKDGVDMKDVWSGQISSFLGMMIAGFPNCFMVYSPQAPTAFSNGPTILECQGDFVVDVIARAEKEGARTVEASEDAQAEWTALIEKMCETLLVRFTNSWWNGGNVYGKKTQMLTFPAGIDLYEKMCREKLDGWTGFLVDREARQEDIDSAIDARKNVDSQTTLVAS